MTTREEGDAISDGAGCLIIVPGDQAELCRRLTAQFSQHANVTVRLDARTGDRATGTPALFALGGGSLGLALRAHVEEQIRLASATPGRI